MEQIENTIDMLDLMARPAFCVKDNVITRVNDAARKRTLVEGTPINHILITGIQEYADFQNGCLYLTLNLSGVPCGASVVRLNDFDVFLLEQDEDQAELQVMALAAQELRQPLTSVMTVADRLFPLSGGENDPVLRDQMARINRGLFQMLRIISNMSDAYRYCQDVVAKQETRDICSILEEVFNTAIPLVGHTGMQLHYTGLKESVYCLVDVEKLERAVHNILSNAMKFAARGGTIDAKLTRRENMLYLTVQDNGPGVPENLRSSIYNRFQREPGIEDSRFGIGLGMVLIRSAAAIHGGTVLMEQSEDFGTRLTMTISIRQGNENLVRSNMLHVDYAGERDHRLLELSESLPASLYQKENIN